MQTVTKLTGQIQRDIPLAEFDVDTALLSVATLMASLVSARIESGAPSGTGNRALLELVKAQEAMVTASGSVAKAHIAMLGVAREVGTHDIDECPKPSARAAAPLRAVA